jgi:hypothetical protein
MTLLRRRPRQIADRACCAKLMAARHAKSKRPSHPEYAGAIGRFLPPLLTRQRAVRRAFIVVFFL